MKKMLSFILPVGVTAAGFYVGFIGVRQFTGGNLYAVDEPSSFETVETIDTSANITPVQLFDASAVKLDALGVIAPQNACGCPGCCAVSNIM